MTFLLLSNSTAPGRSYLEHASDAILAVLAGVRRLTFVPFALADHDAYTDQVRQALTPHGIDVVGAHGADPAGAVRQAEALFVGGGNTFRLVSALHRYGLLDVVRDRVRDGVPYIGSSAGTNVAAPTLRTTNDMPIVEPPSFETFGLVPFQVNPHYLDPVPGSQHQGETREQRIEQFLEENDVPVVGLREGSWLRVDDGTCVLGGAPGSARVFRRGVAPVELGEGSDLADLLAVRPRFDDSEYRSSPRV